MRILVILAVMLLAALSVGVVSAQDGEGRPPGFPNNVKGVGNVDGKVVVTWEAPMRGPVGRYVVGIQIQTPGAEEEKKKSVKGKRSKVTFRNVPPGNHIVWVQAKNKYGKGYKSYAHEVVVPEAQIRGGSDDPPRPQRVMDSVGNGTMDEHCKKRIRDYNDEHGTQIPDWVCAQNPDFQPPGGWE